MQTRPGLPPASNSHAVAPPPEPPLLAVLEDPPVPPLLGDVVLAVLVVPLLVFGPPIPPKPVSPFVVVDPVAACAVALVTAVVAPCVPEGPVLDAALESSGASSLEPPLQATAETRRIDRTAET